MGTSGQVLSLLPWPRPLGLRLAAIACLMLLLVSSYDALHFHRGTSPLEEVPVAPHHCLLCLAAHLPVTLHPNPATPIALSSCPALLVPDEPAGYESTTTFFLYTRPPPQV